MRDEYVYWPDGSTGNIYVFDVTDPSNPTAETWRGTWGRDKNRQLVQGSQERQLDAGAVPAASMQVIS